MATTQHENPVAILWYTAPEKKALTERQILNRLRKIADAEKQKKALEDYIASLKIELIGDADAVAIDAEKFSLKYTPVETSRIDSKRLKTERPDVYADYLTASKSHRFSYKLK